MDEPPYKSCGSVIKSLKMDQIKSTNGTNKCGKRNREKYFELCWFLKICYITKSFPELKQNIEKNTFPLSSSSINIEWKKNILLK